MRITTRIAGGLLLVAALLIGALTYQLSLVDRLQGINQELSLTNLEASRTSILLVQGIEGVREFAAKATALADAEYGLQWEEWESAAQAAVIDLSRLPLVGREAELQESIVLGWEAYLERAPDLWDDPELVFEIDANLAGIRSDVEALIDANESAVAERAVSSAAAGERARLVARAATFGALVLAGVVSLILFLSISGPLRRLTRGTRELAEGRFEHRLATTGPAELSALARDFNHMAERLNDLEELKRDFVSHVSHELKTPLAAMHETVEVLLDELAGPLTAKQRHLLELSRSSSNRLSSMISDLLEASRLEAGGVRWEPSRNDLVEICESVLQEADPLASERGVTLEMETGSDRLEQVCDGDRIREVVSNLVGNAIKFSPEGGKVSVSLARAAGWDESDGMPHPARYDRGVCNLLSVLDQGFGIPDEHKEHVFEKFHQVAGKRRLRGQGVGLGLAISRRIVEAHEGEIRVKDAPGGGALFEVLLPVEPSRWEGVVRNDDGSSGDTFESEAGESRRRAVVSGRRLVLIPTVIALSGCASLPGMGGEAPSPPDVVPVATSDEVVLDEEEAGPPVVSATARLARGWDLLDHGEFEEAREQFDAILGLDVDSDEHAEALWGLALVHLLPGSSLNDAESAVAYLDLVEEAARPGPLLVQVRWAREMMAEVAELRRLSGERQARIQELNETLEMLRRIDLDRRPSGGGGTGG
jgi:signal transduction histidine kinase